jgi:cell division protein FtsI (penicillin-binding protein 3)
MARSSRSWRSRRATAEFDFGRSWLGRLLLMTRSIRVEPSSRRLVLVWGILVTGTLLIAVNLFYVQVMQGKVLHAIARERQQISVRPFVPRRTILDRAGNVLALDRPVYSLFAHPKLFKAPKATIAAQLAPILNRPVADILKQFDQGETGIRIEHALTEDAAERIAKLQLEGIERIQLQERIYPQQDALAGVVGYVNDEHRGQAGIELSQQRLLERSVETMRLSRMGDGTLMPDQVPGGFLNVDDLQLHLTLDSKLQKAAIAALKEQVDAFGAKRGTVIVLDAQNGAVLVLADEPSYNPNEYYKFPIERYKNWALSDLYEPGSTFKPINIAIALEAKAISAGDVFDVPGAITIGEDTIQNAGGAGYGAIDVTEIVKHSSNVGMVKIIRQMKPELYYEWLKALGLGEAIGIDLPAEVGGQFKDRKTFLDYAIEPAVTSFGQGFSMTPMQMAQLHASLANGGRLVTPHVVHGLFDSQGRLYWKPRLRPAKQVFSPATTKSVLSMMEAVVAEGTGEPAQISGYRIGGKTGTAQKASPYGGYAEGVYITSFVGIFPIEAPRFVVLAVVDEPQGGSVAGSTVAAPIVKRVMESLITAEKIPPSLPIGRSVRQEEREDWENEWDGE